MDENIRKIVRHPAVAPAVVGAICFGLGYLVGKRNRIVARTIPDKTDIWEGRAGWIPSYEAVDEAEAFAGTYKKQGADRVTEIFQELRESEPQEIRVTREEQTQVETMVNEEGDGLTVFSSGTEVWEWETELAGRTTLEPYILHKDEFYGEDVEGYTQTTLTYYAGDDILVDQDDRPIYNHISIVGPLRFGHGSDQPGVFFVHNDKLKARYEIVHDEGLYSVEVLGLEIEENDRAKGLKHSVPRFRQE